MNSRPYYAPGDVILRSPVLPVSNIQHIPSELSAFFKELVKDEFFLTSIYIASMQLYLEVIKWRKGELADKKEEEKLLLSLLKYWLRMSTRCTPYGSFAGWTLGTMQEHTKVLLEKKEVHQAQSRMDMDVVAGIVQQLSRNPEIKLKATYYPNNSSYLVRDEYRYIEYNIINNTRSYKVSEVSIDEHVRKVLDSASGGATISDMVKEIVNEEISEEEARAFIDELIDSKILISELEPTITGDPFLNVLIGKLKYLSQDEKIIAPLSAINELLNDTKLRIDKLDQTRKILKSFLPAIPTKDVIQTDLYLSSKETCIRKDVADYIIDAYQKLNRINRGVGAMRTFISKFTERYENAEMPLMHVLDPEVGIGYESNAGDNVAFLNGIIANPKGEQSDVAQWNRFRDFQLGKLHHALQNNQREIVITDDDLKTLDDRQQVKTPDSLFIMGTLLGDAEAIDAGNWQFYLINCNGPAAANLLGRFCHQSELLTTKVRGYLEAEEAHHPDCIFAEIVHSPQARLGNVLIRPILRKYEIPYVSRASVADENQILVSDLYVSVRNNEVILRSKKLNKRVIPRLATAHYFGGAGNLPVYKFLCETQGQGLVPGYIWDWGKLGNCTYLPRVSYGKLILSKAQWRLEKSQHQILDKKSAVNLVDYFSKIQQQLKIPRFVTIAESDNELFIDMENENCLKILKDTLMKRHQVILKEFLSTPDRCFVENEDRLKFCQEVIIPVNKKVEKSADKTNYSKPAERDLQRTFIVGSEWLFVKIYCGIKSAEEILKEVIGPLSEKMLADRVIDKWFFIRYNDPHHHLRVRFHGKKSDHYAILLKELNIAISRSVRNGIVQKVQVDTYQREIERYGYDLIELSEDVFYYDSEAVVNFISLLETDADEQFRWLFALRGADMMLNDFHYSLEEKIALLKRVSQNFLMEFSNEKDLRQQINDKYRLEAKRIAGILDPANDEKNEVEEAVAIFETRSEKNKALYKFMAQHYQDGYKYRINELMPSYLHMFLNRLFQSSQRKQELVVYNYLYRYYESALAIKKKESAKVTSSL